MFDAPKIAAARIDDSRIALSKSATTSSSGAAIKHSAATANLRCATLRSARQMRARAATMIKVNVISTGQRATEFCNCSTASPGQDSWCYNVLDDHQDLLA